MSETAARRLVTVVALDVAGYSALTEADEARATGGVAVLRSVIEGIAGAHGGRVFNTAGDGFMLEFGSSLGAVEAAFELAAKCEPKVRVGVHVGDVVVLPNGDLLGHGVNVAARLMQKSDPGSALVSATVRQTIRGPVAERLQSRGLLKLDKMSETIEVFSLSPGGETSRGEESRQLPTGGEELPLNGSDLIQAQFVQRNRFILQEMCLAFYASGRGSELARGMTLLGVGARKLPLLTAPQWCLDAPLPLANLSLEWNASRPRAKPYDGILDKRLEDELGKRPIRKDPVYRLLEVTPSGAGMPPRLLFSLDKYENYVNTCEVILWSSALAAIKAILGRGYRFFVADRECPLLVQLAPELLAQDRYRNEITPLPLDNRCASVGVNTLTVLRRKDTFPIFLMHRRSSHLREATSTYHVVPAGTFQPILYQDREHNIEFDMNFTALREFAEELYDDKADEKGQLYGSIAEARRRHPALNAVLQTYEDKRLSTFLLGVTLDVVTLKPEILALCVADLEDLRIRVGEFKDQHEGQRKEEPFTVERIEELLQHATEERLLGAAMGCLALALKHFPFIEKQLADLPE